MKGWLIMTKEELKEWLSKLDTSDDKNRILFQEIIKVLIRHDDEIKAERDRHTVNVVVEPPMAWSTSGLNAYGALQSTTNKYSIKNHRLFFNNQPVLFKHSPNQSGVIEPKLLIMHYTGGDGAVSWMTNPTSKVSAHLFIGRDGSVVQMVDFNKKAWHAGESRWKIEGKTYEFLNSFSIGIELDNYGWLTRGMDGGYWFNKHSISPDQVFYGKHKNGGKADSWLKYTDKQLEVAREIGRVLRQHYKLWDVVGHDDVAPGRKLDPGPAFPMAEFRAYVFDKEF